MCRRSRPTLQVRVSTGCQGFRVFSEPCNSNRNLFLETACTKAMSDNAAWLSARGVCGGQPESCVQAWLVGAVWSGGALECVSSNNAGNVMAKGLMLTCLVLRCPVPHAVLCCPCAVLCCSVCCAVLPGMEQVPAGSICASLDGDADRIVFFTQRCNLLVVLKRRRCNAAMTHIVCT